MHHLDKQEAKSLQNVVAIMKTLASQKGDYALQASFNVIRHMCVNRAGPPIIFYPTVQPAYCTPSPDAESTPYFTQFSSQIDDILSSLFPKICALSMSHCSKLPADLRCKHQIKHGRVPGCVWCCRSCESTMPEPQLQQARQTWSPWPDNGQPACKEALWQNPQHRALADLGETNSQNSHQHKQDGTCP